MSFRIPNRLRRSDHLNRDKEPDFPEVVARSDRAIAHTVTLAESSSICAFSFFKACPQILESTFVALWETRNRAQQVLLSLTMSSKGAQM